MDRPDELLSGELASLVGIDNLRRAMAGQRLLENIDGMASLQSDGEFGRQHLPASPVDHRGEINKAFSHRDVGSIQRPDLVGSFDPHSTQEIGIDLVTRVLLAGSRFPVQRFDAHAFHQRTYPPAADFDASPVHLIAQHACAHEWTLQM